MRAPIGLAFPALWLLPGQTPIHAAKWPTLGKLETGLDQLGPLLAQMAARELGHLGRALPAADQGAQNGPAGDSEDVTDHPRQIDVGGLQQLDRTAPLAAPRLDEGAAVAR